MGMKAGNGLIMPQDSRIESVINRQPGFVLGRPHCVSKDRLYQWSGSEWVDVSGKDDPGLSIVRDWVSEVCASITASCGLHCKPGRIN